MTQTVKPLSNGPQVSLFWAASSLMPLAVAAVGLPAEQVDGIIGKWMPRLPGSSELESGLLSR